MSSTPSAPPSGAGGSGLKLVFKLGGGGGSAAQSTPSASPSQQPAAQLAQTAPAQPPAASNGAQKKKKANPAAAVAPPPAAPAPKQPASAQAKGSPSTAAPAPKTAPAPARRTADDEEVGEKYNRLKRRYKELEESRDDATDTLHRAQQSIVRLREEKAALLDRVLMLEQAAGVAPLPEEAALAEYPLLDPPELPDLEPDVEPLKESARNLVASIPVHLPPRLHSSHLQSHLAATKLRGSEAARRAAAGLQPSMYPAIAVLGLEGAAVGKEIERLLHDPEAGRQLVKEGKHKKRDKGKGKASTLSPQPQSHPQPQQNINVAPHTQTPFNDLPNPFGTIGNPGQLTGRGDPTALAQQQQQFLPSASTLLPAADVSFDYGVGGAGSPQDSAMSIGGDGEDDYYTQGGAGSGGMGGVSQSPDVHGSGSGTKRARKSATHEVSAEKIIKPKKLKTHGIVSGTYPIPFIRRNPDGSPLLPMPVGIMMLRKLGHVVLREHFHTERYIFPIGYELSRKYPSMVDRDATVEYLCRIGETSDGGPRFELYPADQPGVCISAGTPTGAWAQVVRAANKLRQRNHSNSVSGPDYFGLAQNIIKALVQELPGARSVQGYIWQNFVEEPDPATIGIEEMRTRKLAGPKKIIGPRRRFKDPSKNSGEDGDDYYGDDGETSYRNESMEPSGFSAAAGGGRDSVSVPPQDFSVLGQGFDGDGMESLLHAASSAPGHQHTVVQSNDPYSLPPPMAPSHAQPLDPSLNAGPSDFNLDPYAIPASTSGGYGQWDSNASAELSHIGGDSTGYDPAFDMSQHYALPLPGGQNYGASEYDLPQA